MYRIWSCVPFFVLRLITNRVIRLIIEESIQISVYFLCGITETTVCILAVLTKALLKRNVSRVPNSKFCTFFIEKAYTTPNSVHFYEEAGHNPVLRKSPSAVIFCNWDKYGKHRRKDEHAKRHSLKQLFEKTLGTGSSVNQTKNGSAKKQFGQVPFIQQIQYNH